MRVNIEKEIEKEGDENEEFDIITYTITITPEDEDDFEKLEEMEDDFNYEFFFSTDLVNNKKNLKIIF